MLYTSRKRSFKHHVHPSLQRRIRLFLIFSGVGALVVLYDIYTGTLGVGIALLALTIGCVVGFITSRIFHLSWDRDANLVIGQIDAIGWAVLAAYIVFEIVRSMLFTTVIHTGYDPNAITFAFVAAALASRVLGLRGRILNVLRSERIFDL